MHEKSDINRWTFCAPFVYLPAYLGSHKEIKTRGKLFLILDSFIIFVVIFQYFSQIQNGYIRHVNSIWFLFAVNSQFIAQMQQDVWIPWEWGTIKS